MFNPPGVYKPRIVVDLTQTTFDLYRKAVPWGDRNKVCVALINAFIRMFILEGKDVVKEILSGEFSVVLVKKEVSQSVQPE